MGGYGIASKSGTVGVGRRVGYSGSAHGNSSESTGRGFVDKHVGGSRSTDAGGICRARREEDDWGTGNGRITSKRAGGPQGMIDSPWTSEDAAVAADAAMDRGVPYAELWRYLPLDVVHILVSYPEKFSALIPGANRPRAWAQVGVRDAQEACACAAQTRARTAVGQAGKTRVQKAWARTGQYRAHGFLRITLAWAGVCGD